MLERCAYCGKDCFGFAGLGVHVLARHPAEVAAAKSLLISLAAKRTQERKRMGRTIADIKGEKGVGGPPMLHGSDVPKTLSQIKITVKEMREAPKTFNSLFILDLAKPVYDTEAFAVNITNLRALAVMAGQDPDTGDTERISKWVEGKTLTLHVALTNNPKTKKMVRSLFFNAEDASKN